MATTAFPCRANHALPSVPTSAGSTPFRIPSAVFRPLCPNVRFLNAQLGDLRALQRDVTRVGRRLQNRLIACQEGQIPVTVLTAPLLADLTYQILRLGREMSTVLDQNRASLHQVQQSHHRLLAGRNQA